MFERVKKWGRRLLGGRPRTRQPVVQWTEVALDNADPRELPRPNRKLTEKAQIEFYRDIKEPLNVHQGCTCYNCQVLDEEFAECAVCTEPLQAFATPDQGICACGTCGNLCCARCARKLTCCAFCRASFLPDRARDVTVERLLCKLVLPCRNARFGCQQHLTLVDRTEHEICCNFSPITCPLHKLCDWQGDTTETLEHLRTTHGLSLVPANGINIEIGDFCAKMLVTHQQPRKYCLSLMCHGKIFICKVYLHKKKLRISFHQIDGDFFRASDHTDTRKFAAWIEIKGSYKLLKGILPISTKLRYQKQLDIPCEAFITPLKKGNDLVKIAITIKEML